MMRQVEDANWMVKLLGCPLVTMTCPSLSMAQYLPPAGQVVGGNVRVWNKKGQDCPRAWISPDFPGNEATDGMNCRSVVMLFVSRE